MQVHWAWKLRVAYEISLGMNYLHTARDRPVIHGDLKINNVLIGYGYRAKVSTDGFLCLKSPVSGFISVSARSSSSSSSVYLGNTSQQHCKTRKFS